MDKQTGNSPKQNANNDKIVSLREIAQTFLHIGFASYSLAALGEAKKALVEKKNWLTDEEYLNGLALSQLLPGAPTVNLNTYIGYYLRGFPGALAAGISFVIPCFLLMILLSHLYLNYNNIPIIASLFRGVGALVVGLVLNTILDLWKKGVNSAQLTFLAAGGFVLVYFWKVNIISLLLIAGMVSLFFTLLTAKVAKWQTIMDCKFWSAPTSSSAAANVQKFKFSKKKYAQMLLMLSAFLIINFLINSHTPIYRQLGNTLFGIGGLTFGSGYAMLPFIQNTMVNQYHFVTNEEFSAALALSLLTPGPVTVISAFIGYKAAGLFGAALAMTNMYLPSFALVNIISDLYRRAGKTDKFKLAVTGVVAAFIGTLWAVVLKLAGSSLVDWPSWGMALAAFGLQRYTKLDTLWIIIAGAVISLFIF